MAKKKTTARKTYAEYPISKPLAFWGIIISGIASLISLIIHMFIKFGIISGAGPVLNSMLGVMNIIANLALFISVFLVAYPYAMGRNKTLRILFWIFSVIAFLGLIGVNVFSYLIPA